jgi:hypothetical protein
MPATSLCARGGKEVFRAHADRLSYQTTAAFNYRDLYCWGHSIRPAMSSLSRSLFPKRTAGSDATRLDTTMLVSTGSRERTESEYQDLFHRTGLTLLQTTPTASELSILEATPAQRRTALTVSPSATGLDQLRWTAEARMPVVLRAQPAVEMRSPSAW